ncbi:E3 ubiquitin-protein ligase RNF186-like [Conger conger]|uniref:E3 ubiquitin-protein ligase RNF186-like n=1 Tax=Conger conger TaxID=82655 RepID=UPI002A5A67E3|nr:E3 ubiquitin-protein ligase RNF186-like [Conger conger]
MVECEGNRECGVCYQTYNRWERIPRVLHCNHALCTLCLKRLCQSVSSLLAIRCPFCRWTTFIGPNLTLQEGLWVHSELWDQISEYEEGCEKEEEEEEEAEEERGEEQAKETQLTQQPKR